MIRRLHSTAIAVSLLATQPLQAQSGVHIGTPAAAAAQPSYADLADLILVAPVIADATIRSASRIKGAEAADIASGRQRFYVEADVASLIRGAAGLPSRIGYLLDLAEDARGRVPSLKKQRVLVFANLVAGMAGQVQLAAADAQRPWSSMLDERVRMIATAALAPDAPPAIVGIGNAFHVPGSLPGEGETQIFLRTADQRPVSLLVLRRPGEERRWSVALSEIVDETAPPPGPETLLRYRLACGLPTTLPEAATASLEPAQADIARDDYRFARGAIGACGRSSEAFPTP